MKTIGILMFVILAVLLLSTCGEDIQKDQTNTLETPKKTYLDTPTNTYLDSRVDAMGNSRKSVNKANKRIEEQNKAMEALTK